MATDEIRKSLESIKDGKRSSASARQFDVNTLECHGCAHSASGVPKPGRPSGERPCFFCIRNPEREQWQKDFEKRTGYQLQAWYDESPIVYFPMDAYQTLDMMEQQTRWDKKAKGDPNWNEPDASVSFG